MATDLLARAHFGARLDFSGAPFKIGSHILQAANGGPVGNRPCQPAAPGGLLKQFLCGFAILGHSFGEQRRSAADPLGTEGLS